MRAYVHRLLPFAIVGLGAVLSGRAAAQSPAAASDNRLEAAAVDALISDAKGEQVEEVTVEGKRGSELGRYRLEMVKAKKNFVEVFNKVNSDDSNDVKCRTEKPTGTRLGHNVCRSKAEEAADASAARGLLDSLLLNSGNYITNTRGRPPPAGGPQVNANVGTGTAQQGGVSGDEQARAKLEAELKKMMAENRELFRAVVKYVEARDDYNEARGQGKLIYAEGSPIPE